MHSPNHQFGYGRGTPPGHGVFAAVQRSSIHLPPCNIEVLSVLGKAYLGIEVGGGEVAPHSHPPWPNVVVLPKQLQPSPPFRTQTHPCHMFMVISCVLHALYSNGDGCVA